jgi:hypothetical protein
LIFINKNWPNDFYLIEYGIDLVEEFENFERTFENDEIVEFKILNIFFGYNLQIFILKNDI